MRTNYCHEFGNLDLEEYRTFIPLTNTKRKLVLSFCKCERATYEEDGICVICKIDGFILMETEKIDREMRALGWI